MRERCHHSKGYSSSYAGRTLRANGMISLKAIENLIRTVFLSTLSRSITHSRRPRARHNSLNSTIEARPRRDKGAFSVVKILLSPVIARLFAFFKWNRPRLYVQRLIQVRRATERRELTGGPPLRSLRFKWASE